MSSKSSSKDTGAMEGNGEHGEKKEGHHHVIDQQEDEVKRDGGDGEQEGDSSYDSIIHNSSASELDSSFELIENATSVSNTSTQPQPLSPPMIPIPLPPPTSTFPVSTSSPQVTPSPSFIKPRPWAGIQIRRPSHIKQTSSVSTIVGLNPSAAEFDSDSKSEGKRSALKNLNTFEEIHKVGLESGEWSKEMRDRLKELGLKAIPSLHGPNSLPYARCPSGVDAFLFSEEKSDDPYQFLVDSGPRSTRVRYNPVPLPGNARYSQASQITSGKLPGNRVVSAPHSLKAKENVGVGPARRIVSAPSATPGGGVGGKKEGVTTVQTQSQTQTQLQSQPQQQAPRHQPQPLQPQHSQHMSFFPVIEPQPVYPNMYGGAYELASTYDTSFGTLAHAPVPVPTPIPNWNFGFPPPPQMDYAAPPYYPWSMPSTPNMPPSTPFFSNYQDPAIVSASSFYPSSQYGYVSVGQGASGQIDGHGHNFDDDSASFHTAGTDVEEEEQHGGFFFPAVKQPLGSSRRTSSATVIGSGQSTAGNSRRNSVVPLPNVVVGRRASANPVIGSRKLSLAPAITVLPVRRSSIAAMMNQSQPTRQPRPPPSSPPPSKEKDYTPHHSRRQSSFGQTLSVPTVRIDDEPKNEGETPKVNVGASTSNSRIVRKGAVGKKPNWRGRGRGGGKVAVSGV